jgi:peptide/nickel transport system permease protein
MTVSWVGGGLRHLAAKVGGALLSQAFVLVAAFVLFRLLPGDPVRTLSSGRPVDAAQLNHLRDVLGVDQPLPVQFARYAGQILHGDLGMSYEYRTPVAGLIASHLGPTVYLVGTATVIAGVLGLHVGSRAAWHPGSVADRIGTGLAVTLWSVPTFWLGLVLISVFASGAGLFPTGGMSSPGVTGVLMVPLDSVWHLTLPCLTLVLVIYAQYLLVMRSSVLATAGSDYLTTARAKGLREAVVRRRHAVPNALLPSATLVSLSLAGVLSGAVLVETVFSWPGLGSLFYTALSVPDLPLLQGLFLVLSASVIVMNLIADLSYPLLDARVRGS